MKVLNLLLSVMLIATLTNCSEDNENVDDNVGSGKISATIDGVKVDFENVQGAKAIGKIAISGTKDGKEISILFDDNINEGSFGYDDEVFVMTYTSNNGDSGLITTGGSVNITKHDESGNHIIGTFDVEFGNYGYEGSVKAKGSFDIKYAEAKL